MRITRGVLSDSQVASLGEETLDCKHPSEAEKVTYCAMSFGAAATALPPPVVPVANPYAVPFT